MALPTRETHTANAVIHGHRLVFPGISGLASTISVQFGWSSCSKPVWGKRPTPLRRMRNYTGDMRTSNSALRGGGFKGHQGGWPAVLATGTDVPCLCPDDW